MSENVGASTCRIPKVPHGLYRGNFTFFIIIILIIIRFPLVLSQLRVKPWKRKRSGGTAPPFLTSSLDGDRLTPGKTAPYTHCIGGCVALGVCLGVIEKSKISLPCREFNPDHILFIISTGLFRQSWAASFQIFFDFCDMGYNCATPFTWYVSTGVSYQSRMVNWYGQLGGMRTGRGNQSTHKGMVRSDMSKPALIFFSLQEYTQQNPLSKF
jgi:hypothetical protein